MNQRLLPRSPESWRSSEGYRFGRYSGAIERLPLPPTPLFLARRLRLKEWHYFSVCNEAIYLGAGLVQLGYASHLFLYIVRRDQPGSPILQSEFTHPGGFGLKFSKSPLDGLTVWRRGRDFIRIYGEDSGWRIRFDVRVEGKRLRADFRILRDPGLSLVFNLGNVKKPQPAYTHKVAGASVRGRVQVDEQTYPLGDALAVSDWTRSLAARETRWKWCALSAQAGTSRLGLNLSAEVYDEDGASQENARYQDGRVVPLARAIFEVPERPALDAWRVRTVDNEVDLVFTPLGARQQHLNAGLLRSDFVQPYGTFVGRIGNQQIADAFGVVEDHHAVW